MATLQGKRIVIIGGSSGIGYGVAKSSLLSLAEHVIIASSSAEKVAKAVARLVAEPDLQAVQGLSGKVTGDVADLGNPQSLRTFFEKVGEFDHLVLTGGTLSGGAQSLREIDLDNSRNIFDVRFWGVTTASQAAKIREGGSITFTVGSMMHRPPAGRGVVAGVAGAVDGLTRGLAVDLAPIRVNVVCPGAVNTELLDSLPQFQAMLPALKEKLPVKHIADPWEAAEAYLFLMKCPYITGQHIDIDGGYALV